MKLLLILISAIMPGLGLNWGTDLDQAMKDAKIKHECVLLSFSGSDWCGPCIQLHKQIFDDSTFVAYAKDNLVLVNADFPRLKKDLLSKAQQKKNDLAADKYNSQGVFPLTVLLTPAGKVLARWEGKPDVTAAAFTSLVKSAADAVH